MLRALVAALVVANLLFFAWAKGWLAPLVAPPHAGQHEPERLAQQVKPETVRIYTGKSAASATAAATAPVCLEAGPFNDADVGVAEAALLGAGVPASAWTREQVQQGSTWLVYMGRFSDAAALRAKQEEMRRLKLETEEVRTPADLAPGLALSRHDSKESADTALAQLAQRGVRTARVVALPAPPLQHWIRTDKADGALRARVAALKPPVIAAAFGPCRPR